MAGDWTSMYAIMQDLSVAQGGMPVTVDGIVKANGRPPTPVLDNDVEEEYYQHMCTGSGDFTEPDLGSIKEMLNMVRDRDVGEDELKKISKPPDIFRSDFTPSIISQSKDKSIVCPKPSRNIAMTSLLKMESDRLLKLNVQEKNATDNKACSSEQKHVPNLVPGNMFKKRLVQKKNEIKVKPHLENVPVKSGEYKPSTLADDYYKEFMERSKAREILKEDIWSRAARQMKEIDAKRKLEKLSTTPTDSQSPTKSQSSSKISGPDDSRLRSRGTPCEAPGSIDPPNMIQMVDAVVLDQQRHLSGAACVVCAALARHGYDVPHALGTL